MRRNAARLLGAGLFGPSPGPAPITGGDEPGSDPVQEGHDTGEDPKLIGIIMKQSSSTWLAFRTQTWGGTQFIGNTLEDARKFMEAACSRYLRQEEFTMADGQKAFRYWSDAV